MSARALILGLLAGAAGGLAAQTPPSALTRDSAWLARREALRAVETRMRAARPGSAALDSARAQRDSIMAGIVAEERARVDSLRDAARRAAEAAGPPRRNPMEGDGPFYGYTWVFWADLATGAVLAWLFAWLAKRKGSGALSAPAALVWMVAGALAGAAVFIPAMMINAVLSVGFSATSPGVLYVVSLCGIVWFEASVGQLLTRKRARPMF